MTLELQQQLLSITLKAQTREAQARRYKVRGNCGRVRLEQQ
jgi:hypothetical protein